MMLTGKEIEKRIESGEIVIKPFNKDYVNPNSYNVTLFPELKVYDCDIIDPKKDNPTKTIIIPEDGLVLEPNVLYLGRTNEYTETYGLVPKIDGRSSIGRLGISVHITAGFGDDGFKGTWTLEIMAIQKVRIYPNMEIGQLSYTTLYGDRELYKGKYQNQQDIGESKMYKDRSIIEIK